jgi:hypothetical protein
MPNDLLFATRHKAAFKQGVFINVQRMRCAERDAGLSGFDRKGRRIGCRKKNLKWDMGYSRRDTSEKIRKRLVGVGKFTVWSNECRNNFDQEKKIPKLLKKA